MKTIYDENSIKNIYGKRVRVYFNLHKKTWSIKDKKTNRVIGYTNEIYLTDCELVVSKKGRERVLKEKRKNVHAYVEGVISQANRMIQAQKFTYNPYKYETFVTERYFSPCLMHKSKSIYLPVLKANEVMLKIEDKKPSQFFSNFSCNL